MKDSFDRTINYLRLSITDRCNLRCSYCMPEEGVPSINHQQILSYEELLRLAAAAMRIGIRKIRVTGGEPLVRKGIVDFIGRLAQLPGEAEIVLTTNGLMLEELADDLKKAGLSRVNVSLDTLRADRFRRITRRDGLDRVLAGLEAAARVGLTPLKINMVALRGVNDDEIVDFARLTFRHPWIVRFIEFMPVSSDLEFSADCHLPAPTIMEELAKLGILLPASRNNTAGPARLFHYPDSLGQVGVIPAVSSHFCGECNRLRITADGRVRTCLFSSEEFDLKSALRANADEDVLVKLLKSAISAKPERHRIGEADFSEGNRRMQGIGG